MQLLSGPIEPNLWRPLTDNELGAGAARRLERWRDAGRASRGGCYRVRMRDNVRVRMRGHHNPPTLTLRLPLGGHHELLAPLEVERHAPSGAEGAEGAAPSGGVRVRASAALTPDGEGQG